MRNKGIFIRRWGSGKENAAQFTLASHFDTDKIVKEMQGFGHKKRIVTAKRHDRFSI